MIVDRQKVVQKQRLRVFFRQQRSQCSRVKQIVSAVKLGTSVSRYLLPKRVHQRVALYASTRAECDMTKVARLLKMRGHVVFLPIVKEKDSPLVFRQAPVSHWRYLPKKHFNIPEPMGCRDYVAGQLDVIFMPLLAFDVHNNRLGMGGGFYDRTLSSSQFKQRKTSRANNMSEVGWKSIRRLNRPVTVGVGYDFQRYKGRLPIEENDCPVDIMLTPSTLNVRAIRRQSQSVFKASPGLA